MHSTDVKWRYDSFDVRAWALGVIFEDCLSGLGAAAAAPVVVPNAAADSAAAPRIHAGSFKVRNVNLFIYFFATLVKVALTLIFYPFENLKTDWFEGNWCTMGVK